MKELKLLKEIAYKERYKYCKDTFGCSPDTASLWLKVVTQNPSKTLLNATLEELNLLLEFSSLDVHERKSKTYRYTCITRYGENYFKEHAKKGRVTKERHYGSDFDKLMMAKAKERGLKNDPDMVKHNSIKQNNTKSKKYGKQKLSEMGRKSALKAIETKKRKYGEDYFREQAKIVFPKASKTKIDKYGTLFPRIESKKSKSEKEIVSFIKEIYFGDIQENKTGLLEDVNKELDVYIPAKNFAIEFDGWFWHSEAYLLCKNNITSLTVEQQFKIKNNLLYKTKLCERKNIRLLHILDLDWSDPQKREIIKSMIASALGIYKKRYFARKLIFKEINNIEGRKVFDENHLQGSCASSRYFALLDKNNQIIQCMSFQIHSNHNHNECELNRMVTLKNTQVIGGFSKLLKNSLKILNISRCVSFIDRGWFDGKGYKSIGFKTVGEVEPSYYYIFNKKRRRREFGMKKNIQKLYEKGLVDYWNPEETEKENMWKNKIPKIWDSGKIKVEYNLQ